MVFLKNIDYQNLPGGLGPAITPNCRVLILGSFPSALSLLRREYYANPRNDFWKIMTVILNIPSTLPYQTRIQKLNRRGIGLWDAVNSCSRIGSADSSIRNINLTPVSQLLEKNPEIRCIACNGRKAESMIKRSLQKNYMFPKQVDFIYLPSSSPAHAIRFEEKCARWIIIRKYLSE